MDKTDALTIWEVQELIYTWFRKLTTKAPLEEMLSMLSSDELEMKFPERTLRNRTDFKEWYHDVTHLFFDQVHEIKMLTIDTVGNGASINLIVNWQARTWKAPAGFSEWQGFYIRQRWVVKKDRKTSNPVIAVYEVGELDPMDPTRQSRGD